MLKFRFVSIFQFEKQEKWLELMELQGLRVIRRKMFCFYEFKQTTPKAVKYIFTYFLMKEYYPRLEHEHYIKGRCNGNKIISDGLFTPTLYRICDTNVDLSNFKEKRKRYLKKVLGWKIALSSMFFISMLVVTYYLGVNNFFGIFFLCCELLFFFMTLYYTIGLFYLQYTK